MKNQTTYSQEEAETMGFDRKIFNSFEDESFIFGSITYQHFIRDNVNFIIIEKKQ